MLWGPESMELIPAPKEKRLTSFIGAGGDIDLFTALIAFMFFLKFVGKDFLGCVTFGAFAGK